MGIPIDQTLLGLMGIAVSVILFVIGYRQTIGAKNERVAAANKEIERILIRRIVLESYSPTSDDITRLLAGKSHDFRVKESDLMDDAELYTTIFTRIFESDLIPSAQRDEILARLSPVIAEAEREQLVEETRAPERQTGARSLLPLLWGALATSALGGIIATLPQLGSLTSGVQAWATPVALTFVGSLGAIGVYVWLARFRSLQEGDPRAQPREELMALEKQVVKILSSAGQVEELGRTRGGYGNDYLLTRGRAKILVELKLWRRNMPPSFVSAVLGRVEETARQMGASEAIIVTTQPVGVNETQQASSTVRFMTVSDLRSYLAGAPSGKTQSGYAA